MISKKSVKSSSNILTNIEYISLGSTCTIAYQLQQLNLRNRAYPFDWIRTKSLKEVIKCLKNSFDGFTDFEYLDTKLNFTYQESDDFKLDAVTGIISVKNSFNMSFLHDFLINSNSDNKIEVIAKYNKRIERFYQTINNDRKIDIVFVRYDMIYDEHNTSELIKILDEVCKVKYKLLLIINSSKEKIKLSEDKIELNKIIIKFINYHTDDWKLDDLKWIELLDVG